MASSPGLRPLKTRKGDRMCVFMLEDAAGSIEVVVFPEAFKQHGHLADNGQTVLVKGKFERDDESARILATEIVPIGIVRERLAKSVAIRLSTPPADRATFERLWDLFAQHKGDRRVAIVLHERDRHIRITRGRQRHPRAAVRDAGLRSREDLRHWLGLLFAEAAVAK